MRPKTLVLGVISLSVATIVLALIFWPRLPSSIVDAEPSIVVQKPQSSAVSGEKSKKTTVVPGPTRRDQNVPESLESIAEVSNIDLEADLKWLREQTTKDVQSAYSQLFEHLGLTDFEEAALSEFLVEAWMRGTKMRNYHPEPMDEQDRLDGIESIIGAGKLETFLTLEQNLRKYREVEKIRSLLERKGAPLSYPQREGLLEILIDVRVRVEAFANPNINHETIEAFESLLDLLDENDRLVLELAPSVLTSKQVQYMFDRYQALSYKRWGAFDAQKRARANDPDGEHLPFSYPHD